MCGRNRSSGRAPSRASICVPVDDLRGRVTELPKEKELLVFCEVGVRGYVAARLLTQRGFRVRNLSGGYRRYLMWRGSAEVSDEVDRRGAPEVVAAG